MKKSCYRYRTSLGLFLLALLVAVSADAATITVTSAADAGGSCPGASCTLRQAIATAASGDTINFAAGITTISLTSAELLINKNLIISGPGANLLTVQRSAAAGNFRIFNITGATAVISGLTIANGQLSGSSFPGSCGGGVLNNQSTLTLSNCVLNGNKASLHGGAILNLRGAVTLAGCTIDQNSATASGGAILNAGYNGVATLTLTNCTLNQNQAGQYGGTIYNDGTSSGNASLTLTNCTLNQNTAALIASGIYNDALNPGSSGIANLKLQNTILRAGASGANLVNDSGTIVSGGHNLSSDAAGGPAGTGPGGFLNATGDKRNTDPQLDLAGLANNGGPTMTIALESTSPAIDGGDDNLAPLTDQRGHARFGVSDIGAFELDTNIISFGGSSIVSAGPNGVLDPGEVVTVALGLKNVASAGICTTAALTGTLAAGGGVTSPSGPQNYGAVCAGGPVVFRNYTFTVDPSFACGATVTATLNVVDEGTNNGSFTYAFTTGSSATSSTENFDGVELGALPAGWTATQGANAGGFPFWVTSTSGTPAPPASSLPNSAFTPDPSNILDNRLESPTFMYGAGDSVTFKHTYDLEDDPLPRLAYDAVVLEISINFGAFTDIVTAGGSFVSGGYDHTGISPSFANPLLPSRPCWSGTTGGVYITTVANLPPAGVGMPVKLRWRMGSDNAAARTGWRIDDVSILTPICGGSAPVPSNAVSRKVHGAAGPFDINLPRVTLGGAVGIENRVGAVAGVHQLVVTFANPVTVGGVSVTAGTGSATFSGNGTAVITIDLTGVTNAQRLGVTLSNVNDGTNLGSGMVPMGVLSGDTTGNGSVNASDVSLTKLKSGQAADSSNFREDVTVNGSINASDVSSVKLKSGTALPP